MTSLPRQTSASRAGRPAKLGPLDQARVVDLFNTGLLTVDEIGRLFSVSPATVYRAVVRSDRELLGGRRPTSG